MIEFAPQGAHRFLDLSGTTNGLFPFEDVLGRAGREMRETLSNLPGVRRKIQFVQARLVGLLHDDRRSSGVVDYVVGALKATSGLTPIKALEHQTGHSRRYLEMLFKERVGVSPKTLARMFRFQRFYRKWAEGRHDLLTRELYDYYHDQSHFAREFKEFTGHAPRRFAAEVPNEFGRRLALR